MIYLIDDDPAVREALHLLLQTYDLPVTCFVSPADCLAHLDRRRPGILIMDLRMPMMSGLQLHEQLLAQGVDWPAIVITGHGDMHSCRRAFKAGITSGATLVAVNGQAYTPDALKDAVAAAKGGHVPIELQPDHLKIEPDHVLADMLRAMHLIVNEQDLPFEPEGGAYAAGHGDGHDHGQKHDHGHSHDVGHDHAHEHQHDPASARARPVAIPVVAQGHVHGPHCNHDH